MNPLEQERQTPSLSETKSREEVPINVVGAFPGTRLQYVFLKIEGKSMVIEGLFVRASYCGLSELKGALSCRIEEGAWMGLAVGLCMGSTMICTTISLCGKGKRRDLGSSILMTLHMMKTYVEWEIVEDRKDLEKNIELGCCSGGRRVMGIRGRMLDDG